MLKLLNIVFSINRQNWSEELAKQNAAFTTLLSGEGKPDGKNQ